MSNGRSEVLSFQQLRELRRGLVTEARKNGAEDGLRALLADLYPDNAHFIYELLQNAEDAGANTVDFDLQRDRLIVSHNGTRMFTLDDIEAITSIGHSSKKDDSTQIGKFGVGFKAVFAYTNRPEVHSGEYAFVIDDLFVPEEVDARHSIDETVFVFPFDRSEKSPSVAYDEVARCLRELTCSTVLFLTQIRTIRYKLADGGTGSVSRDEDDAPRVTITEVKDGDVQKSMWLRLVGHPDGLAGHLTVAAAFSLHDPRAENRKSKSATRFRVQPLEAGETCIYFPAVKETSGLRFHIHAPFASTVARDSIRDTPENDSLVEAIGKLIVESLPQLRDDGLLDDGLLSALPNVDDPLEASFNPVRELIYEAFQEQPLTPVFDGGGFAPADQLVSSPTAFRPGLAHEDLPTMLSLIGEATEYVPKWVAPRTGKAGQFLKGLDIPDFGKNELNAVLREMMREFRSPAPNPAEDASVLSVWHAWLASKSDEQIKLFYELLGHLTVEERKALNYFVNWHDLPIVRVKRGLNTEHVPGIGIYLSVSHDETGPDRVPPSLTYLEADEPSESRNSLEGFYKRCGVERWDERAVIKQRVNAYRSEEWPGWEEHLGDVRMFIEHVESNPTDRSLFEGVAMLEGEDADGERRLVEPENLAIDAPYDKTGLALLARHKYRLSSHYEGLVDEIGEFARTLGATARLTLEPVRPGGNDEFDPSWRCGLNETNKGRKQDWVLPDFNTIVDMADPALLKTLWRLACGENARKAHAVYQAHAKSRSHHFASQIAQQLSNTEWVLDRNGNLRSPQSMTEYELPEGWEKADADSLAIAVGFGEKARVNEEADAEIRAVARRLRVLPDLLTDCAALDEDMQHEVRAAIHEILERRPAFPEAASADPERRGRLVSVDASDAPEYKTEIRERSVPVGGLSTVSAQAVQYLREQYTASDGLYCQACHQPSDFKVNDQWYFEKVQFLPGRKYSHHQNHLALCPLCAAKYKHARQPDDDGLLANLSNLPVPAGVGAVQLPIALNGKRIELKFTGKHAVDLKAVLTRAGKPRTPL